MSYFSNSRRLLCVILAPSAEVMLNFMVSKDEDLSVSTGDASGNGDLELDLESPRTDLDTAMKIVERQKGSLLEELGWARDSVKAILTIVDTVAEVSSIMSFPEAWLSNAIFLGSSIRKARVIGSYGCF